MWTEVSTQQVSVLSLRTEMLSRSLHIIAHLRKEQEQEGQKEIRGKKVVQGV